MVPRPGRGRGHRPVERLLGRIRIGGGTPAADSAPSTPRSTTPCSIPTWSATTTGTTPGPTVGSTGRPTGPSTPTSPSGTSTAPRSSWCPWWPAPGRDMVQSLVNDADQGGWLPKWAIADGDESQMNGDSADPIIAAAYAFGVRNFDVRGRPGRHGQGRHRERDRARPGDRTPVPRPVPRPALRRRRLARPHLHRLLDRRLGDPRVRPRRLLDRPVGQALGDGALYRDHDAAGPQLGVPVQPGHRLPPCPFGRRQLPAGSGLPGRPARARRPAGLRGGQRRPVHLVGAPGPGGAGHPDGRGRRQPWPSSTPSSPRSTPPGDRPTTGPATSRACGRRGSTTTSGHRRRPRRRSAPSPTRSTPTGRPTSPATTTSAPSSSWYVWAAIGHVPGHPGHGRPGPGQPAIPRRGGDPARRPPHRHPRAGGLGLRPLTSTALAVAGVAPPPPDPVVRSDDSGNAGPSARPDGVGRTAWNRPWLPSSVMATGGVLTYRLSSVPDPTWGSGSGTRPPSFGSGRLAAVGLLDTRAGQSPRPGRPARRHPARGGAGRARAGHRPLDRPWYRPRRLPGERRGDHRLVVHRAGHEGVRHLRTGGYRRAQTLTVTAARPRLATCSTVDLQTTGGTVLPPVVVDIDATG